MYVAGVRRFVRSFGAHNTVLRFNERQENELTTMMRQIKIYAKKMKKKT
jgi:hypothetical protein